MFSRKSAALFVATLLMLSLMCLFMMTMNTIALQMDWYTFNREAAYHCYVSEIASFEYKGMTYSCTDFDFNR